MSEAINMHPLHKIMHESEKRFYRRLCRALQAWPTAESLALDMSLEGVDRAVSTWTRYRNGTSRHEPWLCDLLLRKSIEQTRHQIKALEQRLEAIEERL